MTRGILALLLVVYAATAVAATDSGQTKPTDVLMFLGTKDEDRVFTPSQQTFEAGKLYRLVLLNMTSERHHFSAPDFSKAISSRKIEIDGAKITGSTYDLELKAGARGEWLFMPVKAGSYPLECTIPGHAKAGMIGMLKVK